VAAKKQGKIRQEKAKRKRGHTLANETIRGSTTHFSWSQPKKRGRGTGGEPLKGDGAVTELEGFLCLKPPKN